MILSFEKQRKKKKKFGQEPIQWYHLISLIAFPLDSFKKYAFLYTTKTHIIYLHYHINNTSYIPFFILR